MAEPSEDFPIHRFTQDLFDDLALTLPSLGCHFQGAVTPSALTVHGRLLFLKNKLFLLFADMAAQTSNLEVKLRPTVQGSDLVLGYACNPFNAERTQAAPTWDPQIFSVFSTAEGQGFQLRLPAGKPLEVGPPVHWRELAQLYGSPANGRKVLDHFLVRCQTLLADLNTAIETADSPSVLRAAHTIKGSARGVTAVALAEAALQLEMAGRSGDLSAAPDLYKDLMVTYDEFIRWVQEGQL